jgi:amidase
MTELYQRTANELAQLIKDGEVSSQEVVQAHLNRINSINDYVNAVTVDLGETAMTAAVEADAVLAASGPIGPLHGVPFTIKENIDCVGSATTNGIPVFSASMPVEDAPVVARMKAAGAIPIGRTNMPEMGLRLSTDNPLRGRTINPWHPTLTAGGSSGGDAAAIATGMTPFGLGNDIGGSLRNPAYCCGITSLKPTQGRIPHASSIEPKDAGMAVQAMLVQGPMARSVKDLKLGLSILSGRDIRDPRSVTASLEGPAPERKRAALVTEFPGIKLPDATLKAIQRAGKILVEAGYEVEAASPPELDQVTELWGNIFAIDFSEIVPLIQPIITPELGVTLGQLVERSKPSVGNGAVHSARSRLIRLWSEFFVDYPVVIGPTWTQLPWEYAADLNPDMGLDLLLDTIKFITPGNVLGLPSVALPMGVADGLPTGIQIYSDLWREDLCLDAAELIESSIVFPTPIDPVR